MIKLKLNNERVAALLAFIEKMQQILRAEKSQAKALDLAQLIVDLIEFDQLKEKLLIRQIRMRSFRKDQYLKLGISPSQALLIIAYQDKYNEVTKSASEPTFTAFVLLEQSEVIWKALLNK